MEKKLKDKINQTLENMSDDLPGSRGCNLFWGEVEVPECIKKKLEKEEEK